ncbi:MAG: apolipoprotein N-acyltransferase [Coleofasciculaceae cyanobacterium]
MKNFKRFLPLFSLLLPLSGGILMGLTPAPYQAWSLAWVALVPLWFSVVRSQSLRQSALNGFVWGIGYHGLALFWITGVHPMTWMGVPWLASLAIAIFCLVALTLCGAVLVATWSFGFSWLSKAPIKQKPKISALVRVLIGTALWCGLEGVWSAGPLWWTSLSYTQSPHNLVILHLGQLSGPSTVTAAIVAVNGLLAEACISYLLFKTEPEIKAKTASIIYLTTAITLLISLHLIGFSLYNRPLIQPATTALKVGIIQGNIGNDIKLFTQGKNIALENYTKGYKQLADLGIDAVLTPETALPFYWDVLKQTNFYAAILEKGVVAWVGAYGEQGNSYTNSLFTITGKGEIESEYDKVKLVPLGEYIPFEPILGKIIDRLSPLDAHLAAGNPNQLFDTPFGRAIVGICYESAFAEHFRRQAARGGQFILTASNNAHYSQVMPAQHHAQDVMRAVETDRWAARATNTGYSGIVDPHGRTIWISGINTYEVHAATIYRRQTKTLYVSWGDWLTPVLLFLASLLWFVQKIKVKIGNARAYRGSSM